jgi:hypothetical protein
MVDTNRTTRDIETREASQRKKTWAPAAILPEPTPVPGWRFKYIRTSVMGQNDPTNVSKMFREGWEPVKATDHPELMYQADNNPNSRFKDNIEIGGLLLCKAPEELVDSRRKHFEDLAKQQLEAVDNNMYSQKDRRSNMDMFTERKSQVSFGRGK